MKLSNPFRIIFGLLLSITGGIAWVLAFPPYEIWPLVFVGFVPVLLAQHRIMPKKISSLASGVGIGVWLQGYLGPVFAPVGTFMVWLPLIAFALSFLFDRKEPAFHIHTGYRWFVISGVLGWAGIEMIRLFLPVAGTWAFIAYPLYRQLWLIQPASIFGIIGTGMLVMMINYILALFFIGWLDKKWKLGLDNDKLPLVDYFIIQRRWLKIGSFVLMGWITLSLFLWNNALDSPSIRTAAVQPSVSPIVNINRGTEMDKIYNRMIEQTRQAGNKGAQFIVWPEASLNWDPQEDDRLNLIGLAMETEAFLTIGYIVPAGEKGFFNEATVIDPQGKFLGTFGKDHPVVFGGETSLSRGTYPVYDTDIGKIGTIICYDLDYTDTTRKIVSQGAQLIGIPSNDWGSIADKHYTHVVFRAIENRVAMVKADGSYDSAIIDPYGRILELAVFPEGGEATLVADVQIGTGNGTINTLLGDWTGWLGLIGLFFFAFGAKWLENKATKE